MFDEAPLAFKVKWENVVADATRRMAKLKRRIRIDETGTDILSN